MYAIQKYTSVIRSKISTSVFVVIKDLFSYMFYSMRMHLIRDFSKEFDLRLHVNLLMRSKSTVQTILITKRNAYNYYVLHI